MKTSRDRSALRTVTDRRMRIELLRVRADYERLALRRSACQLAGELRPQAWVTQARDHLGSMGLGWLGTGIQWVRRYPVLLSVLTSVLSKGRRGRALKAAWIAGLIWLVKRR